jgi:hypothetical protein
LASSADRLRNLNEDRGMQEWIFTQQTQTKNVHKREFTNGLKTSGIHCTFEKLDEKFNASRNTPRRQ